MHIGPEKRDTTSMYPQERNTEMTYDFTSIMERAGKDALAVDALGQGLMAPEAPEEGFDPIPMWIADMNFPTCPSITQAIIARAQHPAFGYFAPSDAYYQAIIDWQRDHNDVHDLEQAHIGYENGVLGGVVSTLRSFAEPGDAVLVHSPTYIGFTNSLENNGFRIVHSPLVLDESGTYRMDFDDMEQKLIDNHIHVAIFCSPHNPTGRVWERQEIERAMELYTEHDCVVISDEIWSDLILPAAGRYHVPTQSVSTDARQRTVALYAPSKTFNLAGLVGSYHIIYNEYLRDRVVARGSKNHYNMMNVLSMHALIGAYSDEGSEWLMQLRDVLGANVDYVCSFIADHFEGVHVVKPQGTYMLWVDCTDWCASHGRTIEWLEHEAWRVGVDVQDGRMFGGPCHVRMNLALPLCRVEEAMSRLDHYVFNAE